MFLGQTALIALGLVPLLFAGWSNRRTALTYALLWAMLAWLAWLWSAAAGTADAAYVSLALTSCAGVAVLGARRPGAAAWNAVVAGLLAVQLLPLAHMYLSGGSGQFGQIWPAFVGATIAVGLLSYLPTRLGIGATTLLAACLLQMLQLRKPDEALWRASIILAGLSPWLAAVPALVGKKKGECDWLWRQFRDRFGFLWAQRLREQFNASARNAGLKLELGWGGLRKTDGNVVSESDQAVGRELLAALTQRFGLS
jgi:hypothetical protein